MTSYTTTGGWSSPRSLSFNLTDATPGHDYNVVLYAEDGSDAWAFAENETLAVLVNDFRVSYSYRE